MTAFNANVENKVVVITGASSGIGEATARLLAERGAKVVLGARRTERLEALANEIRSNGGTVEYRAVDVTNREDVASFVNFAQTTFGRVDVLFNNAGVMPLAPMNSLKVDEWDNMIDVNIKGVLYGIAAAMPIMETQGEGHIINTASVGAHVVVATGAVYCATKYAVWALSEGLRQESKTTRVTVISPGVVETELGHDITDKTSKDFLKEIRKDSLQADSIARAVLYAIEQPKNVDVNEIVVRPIAQTF